MVTPELVDSICILLNCSKFCHTAGRIRSGPICTSCLYQLQKRPTAS
jgi:hypothetical protein